MTPEKYALAQFKKWAKGRQLSKREYILCATAWRKAWFTRLKILKGAEG